MVFYLLNQLSTFNPDQMATSAMSRPPVAGDSSPSESWSWIPAPTTTPVITNAISRDGRNGVGFFSSCATHLSCLSAIGVAWCLSAPGSVGCGYDVAMWRLLIVSLAVLLVGVTGAEGRTAIEGFPKGQVWVNQSRVMVPAGTFTVVWDGDMCPEFEGCYVDWTSEIHISSEAEVPRKTFGHELGHAFAARHMNARDKQWFIDLFRSREVWEPDGLGNGTEERFANLYYLCMRRSVDRTGQWKRQEREVDFRNRVAFRGCQKIARIGLRP